MPIVGVRFQRAGRVWYFDAGDFDLRVNDSVICDTLNGEQVGRVVVAADQVLASELVGGFRPVVRLADARDLPTPDPPSNDPAPC